VSQGKSREGDLATRKEDRRGSAKRAIVPEALGHGGKVAEPPRDHCAQWSHAAPLMGMPRRCGLGFEREGTCHGRVRNACGRRERAPKPRGGTGALRARIPSVVTLPFPGSAWPGARLSAWERLLWLAFFAVSQPPFDWRAFCCGEVRRRSSSSAPPRGRHEFFTSP
jgi:hypothetical protein